MKGVICYYSSTGNTKLACMYIAGKIPEVEFVLYDMTRGEKLDLKGYEIVGFAAFTDFLGPSHLFQQFIRGLPRQNGKPAFVFNTYGNISGRTLKRLERLVDGKGFRVVAGHSLHTPESYPPMIAKGKGNEQAPDEKELSEFEAFIGEIKRILGRMRSGEEISGARVRIGLLQRMIPQLPRTMARRDMREKHVDELLCKECGVCEKQCPYAAIRMDPKPIFDMEKCYGCWRCYNRCPQKAIYTAKYRGIAHYPAPIGALRDKLKL